MHSGSGRNNGVMNT